MPIFQLQDHLEKLIQFESAARLGKIANAAKELKISPAAISRSIKILENILEQKLVNRLQAGIALTEYGNTLYSHAKKIIVETLQVEELIRGQSAKKESNLRIGTHEALAIYFWPSIVREFMKLNADVKISLTSGRIEQLVEGLNNQQFDLIVSAMPTKNSRIRTIPLYKTKMGLFVGLAKECVQTYPVLTKNKLTLGEVNEIPLLTDLNANPRQGLSMKQLLIENGFELRNIFELNSFEAAIRLAHCGLGIAILPEGAASESLKAKKLRRVSIRGLTGSGFGAHEIGLSTLEGSKDINNLELLIKLLKKKKA